MKIEIVTCTKSLVNGERDLISSINPSKKIDNKPKIITIKVLDSLKDAREKLFKNEINNIEERKPISKDKPPILTRGVCFFFL